MATPAAVLSLLVQTKGAGTAAAELRSVDAAAKGVNANLAATQTHSKKTGGTLRALGGAAKYTGGLIGATGLALGVKTAVSEFREAQKVGAQTNAVLKSTGGAANVTKAQIESLAGAISKKSGIDDEQIQASQNMLLTFTKVRNEVGKGNDIFNQATQVVTDMSVALGQSGKSSAIQLGKALNDPIKGITALRRVGVSFDEDQKKQIETLVKHGNTLAAQKLILRELTKEFGGSAAAQATAGDKLRVALGNVAEAAGKALVPVLDKAADKATIFINQMLDGTGAGGRFAAQMKTVADDVGKVVKVASDVAKFLVKHPALLAAAGAAWVTYKAAALTQIAIVKAAELGLFGTGMRTKLATEAGKTGTTAGKSFAAKAGLAAAAGVAGWEIGSWLRKKSGAVRDAGDFIGTQLGEAIFGGSKLQGFVDKYVAQIQHRIDDALNGLKSTVGKVGAIGNKAFEGVTGKKAPSKKRGPKRIVTDHAGAASAGNAGIVARMSGEAGGQELASLQSALAYVRGHYPGLLEAMIEDAGGSNQHLHIASGNVAAIGSVLQKMGYSISENPAFGGVHGVHTQGSYHYKGMAIDVNADYKSIQAAGGVVKQTIKKVAANVKKAVQKLSAYEKLTRRLDYTQLLVDAGVLTEAQGYKRSRRQIRKALPGLKGTDRLHAMADLRNLVRPARPARPTPFRPTVDTTLDNPWLQAALSHAQNLVNAGQLSEAQGNALQIGYLQNALPHLTGENSLIAQGMIRGLQGTPSSFRDVLEQTLSNFGLSARAGDLTDAQAVQAQIQAIQANLGNPGLTDQDRLELRAELGDLTKALNENSSSNQEQLDAMKALADEMKRNREHSDAILRSNWNTAVKALADVISGQIAGPTGYQGRASTAGAGSTYRL